MTIITPEQLQQVPLTTAITPLPGNETSLTSPSFTFNASTVTSTTPDAVCFHADTWQNGWTKATGSNPTFAGVVVRLQPGFHIIYAYAGDGQEATSVQPGSPLTGAICAYGFLVVPQVTFIGVDTTTQGTWTGQYGAAGYLIANGGSGPVQFASVGMNGDFTYTWANLSSDIRALQTAPGASTLMASAYTDDYRSSLNFNVNIYDGNSHQVALYLLDWDTTQRVETVTISDASTGAVLDSETFSGFHNGEYAVWDIKGNVVMTVTPTAGPGAAVSGIFFN